MCGFFITNHPSINKNQHESIIENTLRFRGPDGSSGLIEYNGWKAYHARLSIIDISSGINQPVINSNGSILVFNGEILNYKELGEKYFYKNYTSDTLLLNDLIINQKLNLNELDGFFSFIFIDNHGAVKFAARDKFGVKPLYFIEKDGYYSFSSEPNTLKQIFNLSINKESIEEYKSIRAPIFSQSYFENIKQVSPGQCLINGYYFDSYYELNGNYENISNEIIESTLIKAIKSRKVSDVPIGLLLSKGIDSNLIRSLERFDKFYSIGFNGDEDIEYLKKQNISNLKIIECTPEEYKKSFEYLLQLRGEPLSVPNEVLLYLIAKTAAKDGVKVLLSGEGADEFFGGYDRIFKWASETNNFDLDIFLKLYCYTPPEKNSLLYRKFQKLFEQRSFVNIFEMVRWFFIRYHMPILFRRLDFSLMAAGVEGREPIANAHLFSIASKLTKEILIGETLGKLPLRQIISKHMGYDFAFEKKVGFPVNLNNIFDNEYGLTSYELWFKENLKVLK